MRLHGANVRTGDVIEFSYADGKGQESARRVRVEHVDDRGVNGFCFLRRADRRFLFERMDDDAQIVSSVPLPDISDVEFPWWTHLNNEE